MAKRRQVQPLLLYKQGSLFGSTELDAMLYTKTIEKKLLRDLTFGAQFSFADTDLPIPCTELHSALPKHTYTLHGAMDGRPIIVSMQTHKMYMPFTEVWERQVLVITDKPKNKVYDKREKTATA